MSDVPFHATRIVSVRETGQVFGCHNAKGSEFRHRLEFGFAKQKGSVAKQKGTR
jgi:hypothetical protein